MTISISRLVEFVAGFPESTDRTAALEHRLGIGTGFHAKWYRSQRDHWLGWLVVQECQARAKGNDPDIVPAKIVWQRLNCSPMMFWLADVAGVAPSMLNRAEDCAMRAKAVNPKDGAPHGRMIREHLPWEMVENAMLLGGEPHTPSAKLMAQEAFQRLAAKSSEYRKLARFVPAPESSLYSRGQSNPCEMLKPLACASRRGSASS